MNKLARYKLDKAFTHGVDIYLDAAPDCAFRVRLPSQYNRVYTQALYAGIDFDLSSGEAKPKGGVMAAKYAQEDAFVAHCMVSIDDEDVPDNFATEYPMALSELMDKANELAESIEHKVTDSVEKSRPTSVGSGSGQGKKGFTKSLKAEAG